MEWIEKTNLRGSDVSIADLKLCELCGALNHNSNSDCFTCGWRGRFDRNLEALTLAFERLASEYEGVRIDHVRPRRRPGFGQYTKLRCAGRWANLKSRCNTVWNTLRVTSPLRAHKKPAPSVLPREQSGAA